MTYEEIVQTLELLKSSKEASDECATILAEIDSATNSDGLVEVLIKRSNRIVSLPSNLLSDYFSQQKDDKELSLNSLVKSIVIK